MQRIPYPDVSGYRRVRNEPWRPCRLNIVRISAHATQALFDAQGQLGRAVANPQVLEPRLRETIILRVAHLSNSNYELHHHVPLGRAAGLTEKDLQAIAQRDYGTLDPLLGAAARFTDEVVLHASCSDETLARLRHVASDSIVVNIVLTIGCYMSIARLIAVSGIELDTNTLGELPSTVDDGAK